jgi:hypothetical protein
MTTLLSDVKSSVKTKWLRQKQQKKEAEQKVLSQIKESGGFISYQKLKPSNRISRMIKERKIYALPCRLSRGSGAYKRFTQLDIFTEEALALNNGSYVCLTKTDMVKCAMQILKTQRTRSQWTILSHYLRRHFSEAERLAIMWHIGYPMQELPTSNLKTLIKTQSISLDGFYRGKRAQP